MSVFCQTEPLIPVSRHWALNIHRKALAGQGARDHMGCGLEREECVPWELTAGLSAHRWACCLCTARVVSVSGPGAGCVPAHCPFCWFLWLQESSCSASSWSVSFQSYDLLDLFSNRSSPSPPHLLLFPVAQLFWCIKTFKSLMKWNIKEIASTQHFNAQSNIGDKSLTLCALESLMHKY